MIAPAAQGEVVSVWSSVVDVRFPQGNPPLHRRLLAGEDGQVVIEVLTHPDQERIRGIALTPTQGLARGDLVMDTGHPLRVPVGERLLGRVLNVLGETTDGLEGLAGGVWRPILQPTVPLALTSGLLDEIPLEGIAAAETTIRRAALAELPDLCRAIEAGASLEEDDRQALLSVVREALRLEFGRQSDGNPGDPETQD